MKATDIQRNLLLDSLTKIEDYGTSEDDLQKAIKMIGTVLIQLQGYGVDYAAIMEIRGRRSPTMRKELIAKLREILRLV